MHRQTQALGGLLVAAALLETLLMRFPPLLDIGTQPGDPLWYTVLGIIFVVVHFPALMLQASPAFWWLIGSCDCFLLLLSLVFAARLIFQLVKKQKLFAES